MHIQNSQLLLESAGYMYKFGGLLRIFNRLLQPYGETAKQ